MAHALGLRVNQVLDLKVWDPNSLRHNFAAVEEVEEGVFERAAVIEVNIAAKLGKSEIGYTFS